MPLELMRGSTHLTIHQDTQTTGNGNVIIEDLGYLGRIRNPEKWVNYTLAPELAKQYGTRTIEHLIVHKLNLSTIDAIDAIAAYCSIKQITIRGTAQLTKKIQKAFTQLAATLHITQAMT